MNKRLKVFEKVTACLIIFIGFISIYFLINSINHVLTPNEEIGLESFSIRVYYILVLSILKIFFGTLFLFNNRVGWILTLFNFCLVLIGGVILPFVFFLLFSFDNSELIEKLIKNLLGLIFIALIVYVLFKNSFKEKYQLDGKLKIIGIAYFLFFLIIRLFVSFNDIQLHYLVQNN